MWVILLYMFTELLLSASALEIKDDCQWKYTLKDRESQDVFEVEMEDLGTDCRDLYEDLPTYKMRPGRNLIKVRLEDTDNDINISWSTSGARNGTVSYLLIVTLKLKERHYYTGPEDTRCILVIQKPTNSSLKVTTAYDLSQMAKSDAQMAFDEAMKAKNISERTRIYLEALLNSFREFLQQDGSTPADIEAFQGQYNLTFNCIQIPTGTLKAAIETILITREDRIENSQTGQTRKRFADPLFLVTNIDAHIWDNTTTTTTAKPPVTTKDTSFFTSPVVVINQTTAVTPKTGEQEVARADLIKIIGITCGALISILIISLVCIRLCRISARERNERVSVRRPLNIELEEHIYAEIEPLQGAAADGPSGASASGSSGVPLPSKKEKRRRRGVSSFRAFSTRIYRWFSTEHTGSDDNQSVFYNRSAETSSVQNAPEPPSRNGRTKRGKGPGVKRYESQSRRPLLDGDSLISTTSSNLDSRDNVYNPLLREEGRVSGPYDHLRLSKTQSGTVKDPEQMPPQSPHDYFTLEKEAADDGQEHPTTSFPMEDIVEADIEDNKSNDNVVDNENVLQDIDEEVSETPKNHEYFILEPTHATIESPKASVKSKSSVKDSSAKPNAEAVSNMAAKTETTDKTSPVKSSGSGRSKPVPKPRNVGSPTTEEEPSSICSKDSIEKKSEIEKLSESAEDKPKNAYTSLGDTLGEKDTKDNGNGKDEEYVITKLGDAPKPPISAEDNEDYLEPVLHKLDYVEVCPNPPPRTTSKSPNVSPAPSRPTSEEYPLVTAIQLDSPIKHFNKSPSHSKKSQQSPSVSPKPTKSPSKERASASPKHSRTASKEENKLSPKRSPTKLSGSKAKTPAVAHTPSVETDV